MRAQLSVIDRLRIERAVWSVDTRLQDLPRRSRIAKRRELRMNLCAAADEVGAKEAVRQLGDLHDLAVDYLIAEYGDLTRRPSWTAAAIALLVVNATMLLTDHASTSAFRSGLRAAQPQGSGTFHWHGLPWLRSDEVFTVRDGSITSLGGAWTPLVYALMVVAAVGAGRLWRILPAVRRRTADHPMTQG
jgi:hypothetical protein